MKITRVPNDYNMDLYLKQKALDECKVCPFCGESRELGWLSDRSLKGIINEFSRPVWVRTGLFKKEQMKVSIFECLTCGAKWESEPYKEVH